MSCTCKYGAGSAGVCGFCKHRAATNERLKKLEDAKASAETRVAELEVLVKRLRDTTERGAMLAHIDGEQARQDAAVAAAVENFALEVDHERDERLARAEKAEAERDSAQERANYYQEEKQKAMAREERACAQALHAEAERDALKLEIANLRKTWGDALAVSRQVVDERDALRAQVEAARAEAAKWPGQCGKFVLRAMDEAKP